MPRARRSISPRASRITCSTCFRSVERKVNRQWAGMADMTPDFAPIMGKTPIEGFYLDAGWGTWGFKATPVSGKTMASYRGEGREPSVDPRVHARSLRAVRADRGEGRGGGGH
jgi:glycine/D-amino acid oxidase-like deaminating enzyme